MTKKQTTKRKRPSGYLKANSKKVLDLYAAQEKKNAAAAYKAVHPKAAATTAASNAYQLLQKPSAQIYLQQHIDNARQTIVELSQQSNKDTIRLQASQDILDRSYGKATNKTETTTLSIEAILTDTE